MTQAPKAPKAFKPTPEQQDCVDKFATGKRLRINAYAGAGKTSVLKLIADAAGSKRGVYCAFNRSIAEEAKSKFPQSVQCSTVHGMAMRAIRSKKAWKNSADKLTRTANGRMIADHMGFRQPISYTKELIVRPNSLGFLIKETIQRWCRSGRAEIAESDVPTDGVLAGLEKKVRQPILEDIAAKARIVWGVMSDPSGPLPLGHDGYLKLWALSRPQLEGDYVLLDEAQDTNGVVMSMVNAQAGQVIAVGDRYQQIYQWRGALNAMEQLPADLDAHLSQSFRFGPAVAEYATRVLAILGSTVPLVGNPTMATKVGPTANPNTILARTNSQLLETMFALVENGRRPAIVGGVKEVLIWCEAADKLKAGITCDYPLELFGYKTWTDVEEATQRQEGADLKRWVDVINRYGTGTLRSVLGDLPEERDADIILSTAHKSKGCEWDAVQLKGDFLKGISAKETNQDGEPNDPREPAEEWRLYYVAATRAQMQLAIDSDMQKLMIGVEQLLASREQTGIAA